MRFPEICHRAGEMLLMLTAVMYAAFSAAAPAGAQTRSLAVGDTLPGFYLKDIDGGSFFLDEYVGDEKIQPCRALIVSLAASYCKPCKKEIPELGTFMETYGDRGLQVVLVALEKEDRARELMEETGTTLPVLVDRYLVVPKLFGNRGIPFTVLVDGDGVVRYINSGFSEDNAAEFVGRLEQAVRRTLDTAGGDGQP